MRAPLVSVDPEVVVATTAARWSATETREPAHAAFLARLGHALAGNGALGVFPDVALELDRLLRGGDPSLAEVTALLGRDVALARQVIVAASSAAHGRSEGDLGRAVTRLGYDAVWRIAMSAVLRSPVFRVRGYEAEADLARTTSLVAAQLGAEICPDPREQGVTFLAGLLAELGTLVILRCAALPGERPRPGLLAEVLAEDATALGYVLVSRMTELPPGVGEAFAVAAGAPATSLLSGRCARGAILAARAVLLEEEVPDALVASLGIEEDAASLGVRASSLAARVHLG